MNDIRTRFDMLDEPSFMDAVGLRRWLLLALLFFFVAPAHAQSYQFDNSAAAQAAYPWIDISGTGTTVLLADDAISAAINLGFTFNYGGTDYTQVKVASNGMLQFAGTSTAYANAVLPLNGASGKPNIDAVMVPLWDDFYQSAAAQLRYQTSGVAPNRVFVVSWLGVTYYCSNTSGTGCNGSNQTTTATATFQVQIYEQGQFVFRYGVIDGSGGTHAAGPTYSNSAGATVGYEVSNTDFVQYSFHAASETNNTTVLWTRNPAVIFPGRFNAFETSTAAGSITGVIKTKVAGSSFNLDLIAVNAAKTAVDTTFTGAVKVELLNASDNTGRLDANNCRSTWANIQTLANPSFVAADSGRKKNVAFQENNSWPEVRVRVTSVATPTLIGCSTDNFAIRPSTFGSFSVTDTDWQTAGTTRTLNNKVLTNTALLHKAGRPFTVRATALNAQGAPATTTNYTGTPAVTLSACAAGTACTAAFGTFTVGSGAAVAGVINSTTGSYSEVGSFSLQLTDQTFANVDATDGSTTAERYITSATIDVGRFVPDHFSVDLTAANAPVLTNRTDIGAGAGCTPASTFTYMDESFGLKYRIEARTFSAVANTDGTTGALTQNYTGAWAKGGVSIQAEDSNNGVNLGTRISNATGSWVSGVYAVNATNTVFARAASPDGAFDNLQLGIAVTDADGPVLESLSMNPTTNNNCVTASTCTGVSLATTKMRFGRLQISNAYGTEVLDLPIGMTLQYWNGNGFVPMGITDICTTFAASDVALSFPVATANHLAACETMVSLPGGLPANLKLTKPGSGNDGWTNLQVNLGSAVPANNTCTGATPSSATTASKPYLRGNWGVSTFDQDPTALIRFGAYHGGNGFIYFRENY